MLFSLLPRAPLPGNHSSSYSRVGYVLASTAPAKTRNRKPKSCFTDFIAWLAGARPWGPFGARAWSAGGAVWSARGNGEARGGRGGQVSCEINYVFHWHHSGRAMLSVGDLIPVNARFAFMWLLLSVHVSLAWPRQTRLPVNARPVNAWFMAAGQRLARMPGRRHSCLGLQRHLQKHLNYRIRFSLS